MTKPLPTDNSHYLFKHHPETCAEDDVWGQVKRTVGGRPVSQEQIDLIVGAIKQGLSLQPGDTLLDICCGNGALTSLLFADCQGGVGVDYSEFLIRVAKTRFIARPTEDYVLSDAAEFLSQATDGERFTKALCYGAFPYFNDDVAQRMLMDLHRRFPNVTRIYLGQLPDKDRAAAFFGDREVTPDMLRDPGGVLGIWHTQQDIEQLGAASGWRAECIRMPSQFFAAHYRFDVIFHRT